MIIQANRISSGYSYSNESMNKNVGREQESDKKISNKNLGKTQIVDMKNNKNPIFMRKNQLKKGAMKIVTDAFAGEQKIDKGIENHQNKVLELTRQANEASGDVKRLWELQADLKKNLGIADDSEEQKDFELLKKVYNISKGYSNESLTKEETERFRNMGPLTEYQETSMEYYKMEVEFKDRMCKANDTIANENRTIEAINLERVKTHPMVDAKKEAAKILDAADKEVVQQLLEEVKDNIDEKIKEVNEKAEEIKDKDKNKDKEENMDKDISRNVSDTKAEKYSDRKLNHGEQIHEPNIDWSAVQKKVKQLLNAQKMLSEDIKGLEVNEEL